MGVVVGVFLEFKKTCNNLLLVTFFWLKRWEEISMKALFKGLLSTSLLPVFRNDPKSTEIIQPKVQSNIIQDHPTFIYQSFKRKIDLPLANETHSLGLVSKSRHFPNDTRWDSSCEMGLAPAGGTAAWFKREILRVHGRLFKRPSMFLCFIWKSEEIIGRELLQKSSSIDMLRAFCACWCLIRLFFTRETPTIQLPALRRRNTPQRKLIQLPVQGVQENTPPTLRKWSQGTENYPPFSGSFSKNLRTTSKKA